LPKSLKIKINNFTGFFAVVKLRFVSQIVNKEFGFRLFYSRVEETVRKSGTEENTVRRFIICSRSLILSGVKTRGVQTGRMCGMQWGDERFF
jgi:hypothetical protein